MKLYIHRPGSQDPDPIDIDPSMSVRDVLAKIGAGDEDRLWLEDLDDELDHDLCLDDDKIPDRPHVHCGPKKLIDVEVHFNGKVIKDDFPPSATIARIYAWATGPKGFKLAGDQKAKHELALTGTNDALADHVHIGSLVEGHGRKVSLDLRPKERFEG